MSFTGPARVRSSAFLAATLLLVAIILSAPAAILHLRRATKVDDMELPSLVQLDDAIVALVDDDDDDDDDADRPDSPGEALTSEGTCGVHKSPNHDEPDCKHWDQGSCGNACCVLEVDLSDSDVDGTYEELVAYLEAGGGDGRYVKGPDTDATGHVSEDDQADYPFTFDPPLPWRYTTSATHETTGGYVDELKISVGVTKSGSKVRMSSISAINGALGDYGQNYKNLAYLCDGLGWPEPTTKFGCGDRA